MTADNRPTALSDPTRPVHDFASDNQSGAHPEILEAIVAANAGHQPSYGEDSWTAAADACFRSHFGAGVHPFLLFTGTAANVTAIATLTRPFEAVICAATAHMLLDECGAAERFAGAKLLPCPVEHGKLTPTDLTGWEWRRGDVQHVQPRVVAITESTEVGTVYTPAEIRALADAAHELDMLLYVDGTRLANAAATLDVPLAALTVDAGVDAFSFGGTKNGLLFGDAIVFTDPRHAEIAPYNRVQLGQCASKMRYVGAQFSALLRDDLWLRNARRANAMASRLAAGIGPLAGVEIRHPVEANSIFARLPDAAAIEAVAAALPAEHPFHVWESETNEVRWMCSWDTTADDVDELVAAVAAAVS